MINRAGQQAIYLGPWTRQVGDTPVESFFVDIGSVSYILAYVDPLQVRDYSAISLSPGNGAPADLVSVGGGARNMAGYHGAIIEVQSGRADWATIGQLALYDYSNNILWERSF